MKPAATLYWVYAVLNKAFGTDVEITRDKLHKRYRVNRYSIKIEATNTPIKVVRAHLVQALTDAGYVLEPDPLLIYSLKKKYNKEIWISFYENYDNSFGLSIFTY